MPQTPGSGTGTGRWMVQIIQAPGHAVTAHAAGTSGAADIVDALEADPAIRILTRPEPGRPADLFTIEATAQAAEALGRRFAGRLRVEPDLPLSPL